MGDGEEGRGANVEEEASRMRGMCASEVQFVGFARMGHA